MNNIRKTSIIALGLAFVCGASAFADTSSNDKLENEIYNHMINRDNTFYFTYYADSALDLLQNAAKRDDYLERSIAVYKTKKIDHFFEVEMQYRTNKEQENYINSELLRITNNLIDSRMSTVEKVEAVNDYVVKIYKYDDTLKSDNVYTALTTKSTICQGYAMTVYKMLKMIGIDCRIINGDKSGTSHAWNLVKIDGEWYHLDSTNNDNIVRDRYLLKSDDYMMSNGFTWDKSRYPSSVSNYFLNRTEYLDYNNDKESDISEYYDGGYWYKDDNSKWHYKRDSGYEVIGWFNYDNSWYYFGEDYTMKTGWININGNWYYLYSDGKLAINTTIDGYSLDENGLLR